MTNEEAIANYKYDKAIIHIRRIKTEETHEREIDRHKAFDLAINALEKQIPKKPLNIEETKYKVSYKCPVCGTLHVNNWCGTEWKLPFCSICGQALDWSDDE